MQNSKDLSCWRWLSLTVVQFELPVQNQRQLGHTLMRVMTGPLFCSLDGHSKSFFCEDQGLTRALVFMGA